MSVTTDVVLNVGLVWAGGQLHGWLSMSQLRCVAALDRRPRHACPTLLCLWRRDKTLVLLPSVVLDQRIGPLLRFNPGAGGGAVWTLGPTVQVRGRLRPVGFCDLAIAIVTMTTMLIEAAAAGPLLWINPTTGGGAAWALGLKAWLGTRWFELAGALVVRQCRCACPALYHLRRRGRIHLTGRMLVRFELAVGRRQGQSSIGRFGLITLVALVGRPGLLEPTAKPRPVQMLGTSVNRKARPSRAHGRRVGYREHQNRSVLLRVQSYG